MYPGTTGTAGPEGHPVESELPVRHGLARTPGRSAGRGRRSVEYVDHLAYDIGGNAAVNRPPAVCADGAEGQKNAVSFIIQVTGMRIAMEAKSM